MTFTLETMPLWDRVVYAGQMILIGMGAIFAALLLLWGILAVFRRLVEGPAAPEEPATPPPAPAKRAPVVPPPPPAEKTPDNGELIAVITAAIAATLAEENGGVAPAFRVVAFQKVPTARRHNK